jgi:hypothetical protein
VDSLIGSSSSSILSRFSFANTSILFQSNQRLQRFLDYLQLDWSQLTPRSDFQRSHLLSMLRELMEWAALLKLASQPPAKLLIRDGRLRSVALSRFGAREC